MMTLLQRSWQIRPAIQALVFNRGLHNRNDFTEALTKVKKLKKAPEPLDQFKLYGLYKQVGLSLIDLRHRYDL